MHKRLYAFIFLQMLDMLLVLLIKSHNFVQKKKKITFIISVGGQNNPTFESLIARKIGLKSVFFFFLPSFKQHIFSFQNPHHDIRVFVCSDFKTNKLSHSVVAGLLQQVLPIIIHRKCRSQKTMAPTGFDTAAPQFLCTAQPTRHFLKHLRNCSSQEEVSVLFPAQHSVHFKRVGWCVWKFHHALAKLCERSRRHQLDPHWSNAAFDAERLVDGWITLETRIQLEKWEKSAVFENQGGGKPVGWLLLLNHYYLISLLLTEVSHTFELQEDLVMRIWAPNWISWKRNHRNWETEETKMWIHEMCNRTSYPLSHSLHSSSPLAELRATETAPPLKHWGTKTRTLSPLARSTSDLVWQMCDVRISSKYDRASQIKLVCVTKYLYWNSTMGHWLWKPTTFTTSPMRYLSKKQRKRLRK